MSSKAEIQQEVAREIGASFEQAVKGYADAGHSMTETATLLGYASQSSFIRLCDRHGWRHWFCSDQNSLGAQRGRQNRRGQDTENLRRARQKRRYPTVEYQGIHDTYAGHARRLGIPLRTMRNRQRQRPNDMDYIFSTKSHRRPPGSSQHPWRRESQ